MARCQEQRQMKAEVAEQADALRSGRSGLYAHVGSTPTFGMTKPIQVPVYWTEPVFILLNGSPQNLSNFD